MSVIVNREMGMTHNDFFRIFPAVATGYTYQIDGQVITLSAANHKLLIRLSAESERRIAQLSLPVTIIEFEFEGFTDQERSDFMDRFDRSFQRGGG